MLLSEKNVNRFNKNYDNSTMASTTDEPIICSYGSLPKRCEIWTIN